MARPSSAACKGPGDQAMAVIPSSADSAQRSMPAEVSAADGAEASAGDGSELATRRARLLSAATARGIPLAAILTAVGVVAATFLAGKLLYRLKDVILLMVVGGFLALILNPLVLALQHWRIKRRGWAVAIVTIWAT